MNLVFNSLPFAFLILVIAQFKRPDSLWYWKFSMASQELAHLFIPLVIAWAVWAIRRRQGPAWPVYFILILLVAVFLRPTLTASKVAHLHDLPFSLVKLFTGETFNQVSKKTVTFSADPKNDLKLDIYTPAKVRSQKWLMVVHGGGWDSGDREQIGHFNHALADHLGIVVCALDYRLAPDFHWPAPSQDLADALKWVQSHSEELHIDPKQYFMLGRSAGGQIAGEVGYNFKAYGLSTAPLGLVLFYSPTEMTFAYEAGEEDDILHSRGLIRNFMGGPPQDLLPNYESASPIQHLSEQTPPTLLIHGQNDFLTWFKHSERLNWRLARLNVKHRMILLPWATHGFDYFLFGPGGQIAVGAIERFIQTESP